MTNYKYIYSFNIYYLIIGIIIGLIIGKIISKKPKIVYKYKKNNDPLIYKDNNDKCYKYVVDEIKCPSENINTNNIDKNERIDHPIILN